MWAEFNLKRIWNVRRRHEEEDMKLRDVNTAVWNTCVMQGSSEIFASCRSLEIKERKMHREKACC